MIKTFKFLFLESFGAFCTSNAPLSCALGPETTEATTHQSGQYLQGIHAGRQAKSAAHFKAKLV
jgi:hypothetical protein